MKKSTNRIIDPYALTDGDKFLSVVFDGFIASLFYLVIFFFAVYCNGHDSWRYLIPFVCVPLFLVFLDVMRAFVRYRSCMNKETLKIDSAGILLVENNKPVVYPWGDIYSITIRNSSYPYTEVCCIIQLCKQNSSSLLPGRVVKILMSEYSFAINPFRLERALRYFALDNVIISVRRIPAYIFMGVNLFRRCK